MIELQRVGDGGHHVEIPAADIGTLSQPGRVPFAVQGLGPREGVEAARRAPFTIACARSEPFEQRGRLTDDSLR